MAELIKTAELEKTFDFEIQPSTLEVSGSLPPGGEAEVTFQVCNTSSRRLRAEVILGPEEGPKGPEGTPIQPEDWAYWLTLMEPPEYDYQPQSVRTYTVKIKVGNILAQGQYAFHLRLVGHDDPDNEYMESKSVAFKVAIPPFNARPFIIAGIVLLVLVIAGIVTAILLSRASAGLKRTLTVPDQATVGEPALYTLVLQNKLKGDPAKNVVLDYTYPAGVQGAWAEISAEPALPAYARCGSSEQVLRCALGDLAPDQTVTLNIYALPGPLYGTTKESALAPTSIVAKTRAPVKTLVPTPKSTQTVTVAQDGTIENQGQFILHWIEKSQQFDEDLAAKAGVTQVKAVDPNNAAVSGAAIPATNVATVGLPVKIWLVGWNNKAEKGPVTLQYKLPNDGSMRFAGADGRCKQQADYFTLICTDANHDLFRDPFYANIIPLQPSAGIPLKLSGGETGTILKSFFSVPTLLTANNQIVLNGVDEWAQLGVKGLKDIGTSFTVELWVDPHSLEDGQALIGAHRHSVEKKEVINTFLVGYYNGALNINVMGECSDINLIKTAEPFHLAVVVDSNQRSGIPVITPYINGKEVPLKEGVCCRPNCDADAKIEAPSGDQVDFNWVIGQDWDADGSGIVASDFFHGAISDVRIIGAKLDDTQIQEDMFLPPPLCSGAKGEACDRTNLIGWWPLAQNDPVQTGQKTDCWLAKNGNLETRPISNCTLVDLGSHGYNGARSGGTWESANIDFGNALAFDGSGYAYSSDVKLSDFKLEKGVFSATLAAWISVDAIPSRRQIILADVYEENENGLKAAVGLIIDNDGHVSAYLEERQKGELASSVILKDEKPVPVGRWVHYALTFGYRASEFPIAKNNPLFTLIRNGESIKTTNLVFIESGARYLELNDGFYLGGFGDVGFSDYSSFTGKIDEVRVWNRIMTTTSSKAHVFPEIDLWRRMPGTASDEYVYWSFDNDTGQCGGEGEVRYSRISTRSYSCDNSNPEYRIPDHKETFNLIVDGPSWIPSNLNLAFNGMQLK